MFQRWVLLVKVWTAPTVNNVLYRTMAVNIAA